VNSGGPGNPFAQKVDQWRDMLKANVSEKNMADVIRALVKAARRSCKRRRHSAMSMNGHS
jgi:hypothetical protein